MRTNGDFFIVPEAVGVAASAGKNRKGAQAARCGLRLCAEREPKERRASGENVCQQWL